MQLYRTMEVVWDATARSMLLVQERGSGQLGVHTSTVSHALLTGAVELTTMVQPTSLTQIGPTMVARSVVLDVDKARRAIHILAWDHLASFRSARTDEPMITAERFERLVGADEWTSGVIREIETAKSRFFTDDDYRQSDMRSPDSYSNLVYARLVKAITGCGTVRATSDDWPTELRRHAAMTLLRRDGDQYWRALGNGEVPGTATVSTYMNSWVAFQLSQPEV